MALRSSSSPQGPLFCLAAIADLAARGVQADGGEARGLPRHDPAAQMAVQLVAGGPATIDGGRRTLARTTLHDDAPVVGERQRGRVERRQREIQGAMNP